MAQHLASLDDILRAASVLGCCHVVEFQSSEFDLGKFVTHDISGGIVT